MAREKSTWSLAVGATLDFSVNWTDWLETGETISSHDWTVPTGLTEGASSEANGVCTVWLTAGSGVGTTYTTSCTITTSMGRTDTRSLYITIRNR